MFRSSSIERTMELVWSDPMFWVAASGAVWASPNIVAETRRLFHRCREEYRSTLFWIAVVVWWSRAVQCGGVLGVCGVWAYDRILWPLSAFGRTKYRR